MAFSSSTISAKLATSDTTKTPTKDENETKELDFTQAQTLLRRANQELSNYLYQKIMYMSHAMEKDRTLLMDNQLVEFILKLDNQTAPAVTYAHAHKNERLLALRERYNKKIRDVSNLLENLKEYTPPQGKFINPITELHEVSKTNDVILLRTYLEYYHGTFNREHINRALRTASAHGGYLNVILLMSYADADILSQGAGSGQIALHQSMKYGLPLCAEALLNGENQSGLFDPVSQLLTKDSNNKTPLDCLASLEESAIKENMKDIIRDALTLPMRANEKDIELIRKQLDTMKQVPKTEVQQQESTNSNASESKNDRPSGP